MPIPSCSSILTEEKWSGSVPYHVCNVDEHVDIGPLLTVRGRLQLHPQAVAVVGARGRIQDRNDSYRDLIDILSTHQGKNYIKPP